MVQRLISEARAATSAKLGRCEFCIRSAGRAVLLSWAAALAVLIFWRNPIIITVSVSIALALTGLMFAHVGALTTRAVRDEGPSRRSFLRSAATIGVSGVAFSLFGHQGIAAAHAKCSGKHNLQNGDAGFPKTVSATNAKKDLAQADAEAKADAFCDGVCAGKIGCPQQHHCVRSSHAKITKAGCVRNPLTKKYTCTVVVTQCACACVR